MRAFAIWEGGLGIWGAIALGGVGAWIACRRRGIPLPAFADALAPGLLVAQAIGRLGNWFNNELYGGPTDLPWALKIYEWDGGRAALGADNQPIVLGYFHPTFLYELLWNLAAAALVDLGRPPVPARPRPGLRALRRQLLRRAAVDRAAAHRPGRALLRRAAQRLHLDRRRACSAVAYLSCSAAARARSSTAAPKTGRRAADAAADPGPTVPAEDGDSDRCPRVRMITGPPTRADAFPQARAGQEPT